MFVTSSSVRTGMKRMPNELFRGTISFSRCNILFFHSCIQWAVMAVLPVYVFLVLVRGSPFGI